ncbi:MAG: hypothetical protein ACM30H_00790 [Clostridia bacterium]
MPLANARGVRDLQPKLLDRAMHIAGGWPALARELGIPETRLKLLRFGPAELPPDVFLRLVDLVLQDDLAWAAQDRRGAPRDHTPA